MDYVLLHMINIDYKTLYQLSMAFFKKYPGPRRVLKCLELSADRQRSWVHF